MDFKKILFLSIFTVFLPIFVFAAENDYLFVSVGYDFVANKAAILSIEQRVLDPSQVLISDLGDFELLLLGKNGQVFSRNTFVMPLDEEIEVILEDGSGIYTRTNSWSTTIILPLNSSLDAEDLSLQIKKDGQIIFNEKFSARPFAVLETKENTINTLASQTKEKRFLKYLIWAIISLVLFVIWRWWVIRNRASQSDYMMR